MNGQDWDHHRYRDNARFVPELGTPLIGWLAPRPGEHVLDLGCGDGALTEKVLARGCDVVAVDASPDMVAAARRRNLNARVMDGAELAFESAFDAVFSNAALHWMSHDPDGVIAGVLRALKPGGRFVAEMGGKGNVEEIVEALENTLDEYGVEPSEHNPWYFPDGGEYRRKLETGGFRVDKMELFQRPTELPGDVRGWLETFAGNFTSALPPDQRTAFLDTVQERLLPGMRREDGRWIAGYVRLRFKAFRLAD